MTVVYDTVIRNGTICDGTGAPPTQGDLAIQGDAIAAIGRFDGHGNLELDATGRVVAPGFINMLSWATESLVADGRSQSDIHQGVTLEVFGEGSSLGPLNPEMKANLRERQSEVNYDIDWTSLDEGLQWLVRRGISCNVASFVGATTLRIHEVGYVNRPPESRELDHMRGLMREAMQDGGLGVGSSLIYAPAQFAGTDELTALSEVAAEYGGMYISHIRNESKQLLEALEELISISERSGAPAEVWHFKASGPSNWPKLDQAIERIEAARRSGQRITADVYTYHASSTGLDSTMPGWVQEGGHRAWVARLRDPSVRKRLREELSIAATDNEFLSAEKILLVGFRNPSLRNLTGKTVAEVAAVRGTSVEDTIMDLVVEDDSRVQCVFFTMSEDNVRKAVALPWVAFCSDAGSLAAEGIFLKTSTHPRAYGSFARVLGKYVREEGAVRLEEAVRRLSSFPAENLGLDRRGRLSEGFYADVVVFDPASIRDHATYDAPHQYATGVQHVFVNGVQVLEDGQHTDARPGRVVRGQGYTRGPR
ncbi:MAG: D-aminoacylase [Chloroflexi bacterium]|nr:D-aminoacylase [Chloroflexota bacterium]MBV9892567.1 D-aminoacylase [Chloroflexota bacterium]